MKTLQWRAPLRVIWLVIAMAFGIAMIVASGTDGNGDEGDPDIVPTQDVVTVENPRVSLDGNGSATIAYNEVTSRGGIARNRLRATLFDPAADSFHDALARDVDKSVIPRVASDESGTSFVAFSSPDGGLCRFAPASFWLCEVQPTDVLALAMDGAARALSFDSNRGANARLVARHFAPAAGWGPELSLSNDGQSLAEEQPGSVAYWSGGAGFAAWIESDRGVRVSRFLRTSETWENPVVLGTSRTATHKPRVALARNAPNAAALVVWPSAFDEARFSRFIPGTGWTAAELVPIGPGANIERLDIVMSDNGDALLLVDQVASSVIALRFANGSWGSPQTLITTSSPHEQIAMDGAGNGVVAWVEREQLQINRFVAGSGWRGAQQIATVSTGGVLPPFDLDMDAAGRIVVASVRLASGAETRLQVHVLGLFELSISPAALDVPRNGASGSVDVVLARTAYSGTVGLEVLDCPAKVICTLSRAQIPAGESSATLTFITNAADPAAAGTFNVRVAATGGAQASEAVVPLTLTPVALPQATLRVDVAGNGRVVSSPAGIDCSGPQSCSAMFARNSSVGLVATPGAGQAFAGFGGAADCSDGLITLVADTTCTATFNAAPVLQWLPDGAAVNRTSVLEAASVVVAPAIEIGADGQPVVAFPENGTLVVRRWTGGVWQDLGAPPDNGMVVAASLTIDSSGAPVVAWEERTVQGNDTRNVRVARWDGAAWNSLGPDPLNPFPRSGNLSPAIRARSADIAVVWNEPIAFGARQVESRLWSGGTWLNAGVSAPVAAQLDTLRLAVSVNDDLALAWVENFAAGAVRVAELKSGVWTPTAIAPLPDGLGTPIESLDLAYVTGQGLLVVAQPTSGGTFQVRRWASGAWTDFGTPRGTATGSVFGLGFSHNRTGALPLLAHARRTGSVMHEFIVERFSGMDWAIVGAPIPAIDRNGDPGFEFRVGVADAAEPRVATLVIGSLENSSARDDAVVVYRFR